MDTTKMWDYRVVRQPSKDGNDGYWYSIQEVYYDDETGEPMAQTIDLMIEGDTITGMRTQLELMLKSLEEPVLDESDITHSETPDADYHTGPDGHYEKSIEERVLELEMKNAELRDRLTELGDKIENLLWLLQRHSDYKDDNKLKTIGKQLLKLHSNILHKHLEKEYPDWD